MAKTKASKNKIIIAVVVLILVALGLFLVLGKKGTNPLSSKDNTFTSIQDALSKSISLECEFTDESGRMTKSYVKNGAIRADITASNADESGSVILKDKKMYFWNAQGGFMMEVPDVKTDEAGNDTTEDGASQGTDVLKAMEEFKDHCKPAVVSDSLFTPPADVTFTDMSKLIPTGATQTGGEAPQMTQEEINKYMQQYQNPAQ